GARRVRFLVLAGGGDESAGMLSGAQPEGHRFTSCPRSQPLLGRAGSPPGERSLTIEQPIGVGAGLKPVTLVLWARASALVSHKALTQAHTRSSKVFFTFAMTLSEQWARR